MCGWIGVVAVVVFVESEAVVEVVDRSPSAGEGDALRREAHFPAG